MALSTNYQFKGNAEELRVALLEEVRRRFDNVASTEHAAGERYALESLMRLLEQLTISDDVRGELLK